MAYSHAQTNAKLRYKTTNWKQYNQALINRGSLTLWVDEISANGAYDTRSYYEAICIKRAVPLIPPREWAAF